MLEKATRICEAKFGVLELCEDGGFRMAALHNPPPAYSEARRGAPVVVRPTVAACPRGCDRTVAPRCRSGRAGGLSRAMLQPFGFVETAGRADSPRGADA